MKKNSEKIWQNPWVIGIGTLIIGTLILNGIDWLVGTKIISSALTFLSYIFSFIIWSFDVQLWSMVLIVTISFLAGSVWVKFKMGLLKNAKENKPEFLKYTSDEFDGVLYKWEYHKSFDDKYSPSDFTPYCPKDNAILHHGKCLICKRYFGHQITSDGELEKLVIYKIQNDLIPK